MSTSRIRVAWTAWGTAPPYGVMYERWLTQGQHGRFTKKINRDGLAAAFDYALKVGSKNRDDKRERAAA